MPMHPRSHVWCAHTGPIVDHEQSLVAQPGPPVGSFNVAVWASPKTRHVIKHRYEQRI